MTSLKFMTVLLVSLSPSLLKSQTMTGADEISISAGQTVPWDGILTPEPQYRFYQDTVKECAYKDLHPRPCYQTPQMVEGIPWAISGIIVGFLAGLTLK